MERQENSEELTLEEMMEDVENILKKLEQGGVSLEDSFSLYEQGMCKLKQCNEKIDSVEKKMLMINSEGNLEEF